MQRTQLCEANQIVTNDPRPLSRTAPRWGGRLVLVLLAALCSCGSFEDKRIRELLHEKGFGSRAHGDATRSSSRRRATPTATRPARRAAAALRPQRRGQRVEQPPRGVALGHTGRSSHVDRVSADLLAQPLDRAGTRGVDPSQGRVVELRSPEPRS